jgi:hypothetical protein
MFLTSSISVLSLGLLVLFAGDRALVDEPWQHAAIGVLGSLLVAMAAFRPIFLGVRVKSAAQRKVYGVLGASYGLVLLCVLYLRWAPGESAGVGSLGPLHAGALTALFGAGLSALFVELRSRDAQKVECPNPRVSMDASRQGFSLGLVIAATFAFNAMADRNDRRFDLTTMGILTPSPETLAVTVAAETDVELVLFSWSAHRLSDRMEAYFDELARSSDHISFEMTDVDLEPELANELRVRSNVVLVLISDDRREWLEIGQDPAEVARAFSNLDARVRARIARLQASREVVYLLEGHGERSVTPGLHDAPGIGEFADLLASRNFATRPLNPSGRLAHGVPRDASVVVVPGPQTALTPEEFRHLRDYLDQGGSILLLFEPESKNLGGFDSLLDELGIKVRHEFLVHGSKHDRRRGTVADRALLFSPHVRNHPSTKGLASVVSTKPIRFWGTGSLWLPLESPHSISWTTRSVPGTWMDEDGDYEFGLGTERQISFTLSAAIEFSASQGGGRIVMAADPDLISNLVFEDSLGNQQWADSAISWLARRENLPTSVVVPEDAPVQMSRAQDRFWFYGVVVSMPLLIIIFGGLIPARQRKRKKDS